VRDPGGEKAYSSLFHEGYKLLSTDKEQGTAKIEQSAELALEFNDVEFAIHALQALGFNQL